MSSHLRRGLAAAALASALAAPAAGARTPPTVHTIGHVETPVAFAFAHGQTFVAGAGSGNGNELGRPGGGIFALRHGRARLVPGSSGEVFGLTTYHGTLFSSSGPTITAWRGWNGRRFAHRRTVWTGPDGFPGANGLAVGPDGRIYFGVREIDDHSVTHRPFAQSVVSIPIHGGPARTVARGIRQPWQEAFVPGRPAPYVTVLGQDEPAATTAPDWIIHARPGQDYGFPGCTWITPCAGHPRPFRLLHVHASPMGIAYAAGSLYVALFGGTKGGPGVVRMSPRTGRLRRILSYPVPLFGLGAHGPWLYLGDVNGGVHRLRR